MITQGFQRKGRFHGLTRRLTIPAFLRWDEPLGGGKSWDLSFSYDGFVFRFRILGQLDVLETGDGRMIWLETIGNAFLFKIPRFGVKNRIFFKAHKSILPNMTDIRCSLF